MVTGFDHVTLVVRELAQATARYEQLLGRSPIFRGEHPALGSEAAIFGLANAAVELLAPKAGAQESEGLRELLAARGEGVLSLTFAVQDAEEAHRTLRARGLRVAPPEEGEAQSLDGSRRAFRTLELSRRSTRGIRVFGVERAEPGELRARDVPANDAVEALDHVAIRTSEPDAVKAIYGDGLGLRLALDRNFGALRMLFFRTGGVTLEFVLDPSLGEADAFYGLAFRVRDIEAAHARLSRHGFALSAVRAGAKPNTQVFSVRSGTHDVPTLIIRDPARD